jgi:hypothetical protein
MAVSRPFPTRGVLRRPQLRLVDLIVGAGVLGLLYGVYRLGQAVNVPFTPSRAQASERAPLVRSIGNALAASIDGRLSEPASSTRSGAASAKRKLATNWGRYGELFEYDANTGELALEPTPEQATGLA